MVTRQRRGAEELFRGQEAPARPWRRLARETTRKESLFRFLRDALDIDQLKAPALYFGTMTGQFWLGRDGGKEWTRLFDSLRY
jgi:hypothetical protein